MEQTRLTYLINRYSLKELSAEEWDELSLLLNERDNHSVVLELADAASYSNIETQLTDKRLENIPDLVLAIDQSKNLTSTRPIHWLRAAWPRYAAAVILLFSIGTYLYYNNSRTELPDATSSPVYSDIKPGGNKAILILDDKSIVSLDSLKNGETIAQGNMQVTKSADGQLIYVPSSGKLNSDKVFINTMKTPRGGQYQLKLPDGSKVWLNAASAITYPTRFEGTQRKVSVTGEVYFEVAPDKNKPFIVDVDGKSSVEVLGTSFNVNAYSDEQSIRTTLIEGRVRVFAANQYTILQPGQQAQTSPGQNRLLVNSEVAIDQVMAWKNGIFNFNGVELRSVMRQLERWYDIQVQYKGAVSKIIFKGKMYRNVNLSDVLEMLKEMGVKFELQGKMLTIS